VTAPEIRALGVDGARGGWVAVEVVGSASSARVLRWHRLPAVVDVLALAADVVGIDMPIGLPERGRRPADLAAKSLLGAAHPRVFLTPPRGVLDASSYEDAAGLHRKLTDGLGISVQTWNIVARIREVDGVADDPRLVEVHPELSFALLGEVLAGADALPSKKTAAGRAARLRALGTWLPGLDAVPGGDDGIDALVCAWSALRWYTGTARTLPELASGGVQRDARGRPMRIVT
jgi:predicted RNase H-like nuclease